jgi:Phage integrase family
MAGRADAHVFVPYDLRHTAATRWATDGMPLPVLAATLGHANLRSVMKYIHITADNIEHEMVRIEKMRLSRTSHVSETISMFDLPDKEQRVQLGQPGCTSFVTVRTSIPEITLRIGNAMFRPPTDERRNELFTIHRGDRSHNSGRGRAIGRPAFSSLIVCAWLSS